MGRQPYTAGQIEFLRAFRLFSLVVITAAFNTHFGTDKLQASIQSAYKNHGIKRLRNLPHVPRVYTPEKVAWLRENYPLMDINSLAKAYNDSFGTDHTAKQLHSVCGRFKISSGRTGRFGGPGFQPWNTGTKGQGLTGPNKASFKKGNLPHNHKPLWSERVCSKDGYISISVPETNPYTGFPTRYKHKHVWVWEQTNGPVPKGSAIIFGDGNLLNCDPENLICVTRSELLVLNQHNYAAAPLELKPSILALARLETKAGFRTCPGRGRAKRKEI